MAEFILILLMLIPSIFIGIILYVMKIYTNTNDKSDKNTNDKSDKNTNDKSDKNTNDKSDKNTNDENNREDKETVNIGDVFVYEPIRIRSNPFKDVRTTELDSRTYIIDDLKTNYEGVVWVKYHSLSSHRRKTVVYCTSSIDEFLWRSYKHNELKHLFE